MTDKTRRKNLLVFSMEPLPTRTFIRGLFTIGRWESTDIPGKQVTVAYSRSGNGKVYGMIRLGEFVQLDRYDECYGSIFLYGRIVSEAEKELVVERVRKEVCEHLFYVR